MTLEEVKEQHPEALETMSDYEAQVQLDMGNEVSQTADEAEAPKSRIAQLAQSAADKLLKRSQQTEQQAAQAKALKDVGSIPVTDDTAAGQLLKATKMRG